MDEEEEGVEDVGEVGWVATWLAPRAIKALRSRDRGRTQEVAIEEKVERVRWRELAFLVRKWHYAAIGVPFCFG